jgi:DNA-binding beta-propeller fold protein YncE
MCRSLVPSHVPSVTVTVAFAVLVAPPPAAQQFPAGRLFVASGGSDQVLVFDEKQNPAGEVSDGASPGQPRALVFGPDGRLYVSSQDTGTIAVFNAVGDDILTIPVPGPGSDPVAMFFGPDGLLHVLDAATDMLVSANVAGAPQGAVPLPAGDYAAAGLALGADGHLFLSDAATAQVLELDLTGALIRAIGGGDLTAPAGLAFGPDGLLYVADDDRVVAFDDAGAVADTLTGGALSGAGALAFGPDGHLYVAAAGGSGDVVEFNGDGAQVKAFGSNHGLTGTGGLAFAPWRFKATIAGSLARPGEPLVNVKETNAVVSVQPGARTLMLAFTDDVSNAADLASVFSTSFLVLRGFEGAENGAANVRLFHGAQVAGPAQQSGVASFVLRIKGSMKAGGFVPKNALGVVHRAGAAGVYTAAVKTTGLLK